MRITRVVVVFDAADIETESAFWAGLLGGQVHRDEGWHSVVVDGEWVIGVQHAPGHVPPQWPEGTPPQQVHLDLHVDDLRAAVERATALGARRLQAPRAPADNPDGDERYAVLADPAGHPFCLGVH
jgi:catechol 2,3-dioxygenase-like lactoylglutathione lyase family enzyme